MQFIINQFCPFNSKMYSPFGQRQQYAPLNPFEVFDEDPQELFWEAPYPTLAYTGYQQEDPPLGTPFAQNQAQVSNIDRPGDEIEPSLDQRTRNRPKERIKKERYRKKKSNSKQSAKHNFSTLLVRQIKRQLRVRLQVKSQQIGDKYLRFVLKNLKQSRFSLKFYISLGYETTGIQIFEPFFNKHHIGEEERVELLRECKQYFRNVILNAKSTMLEVAQTSQVKQESKNSFVQYVGRFLQQLSQGVVKLKDKKETKRRKN